MSRQTLHIAIFVVIIAICRYYDLRLAGATAGYACLLIILIGGTGIKKP